MTKNVKLKPFIKWVGGKTQILKHLHQKINKNATPFQVYFEPFLGGGALFLSLSPKKAILNDFNRDLIQTWEVVCDYGHKLVQKLEAIQKNYNGKEHFYFYRDKYNEFLSQNQELTVKDKIQKAALFIFLNKTCFNGLYRVNSNGKFNVPWNQTKKFSFDKNNLLAISDFLKKNQENIRFFSEDFAQILKKAQKNDLIYLDPPYYPLNETGFVNYTSGGFLHEDQERLLKSFNDLHEKECKVILSNHETPEIMSFYKDYDIEPIQVKRMINCKGDQRQAVDEVIVSNLSILKKFTWKLEEKIFSSISNFDKTVNNMEKTLAQITSLNYLIGCSESVFKQKLLKLIQENPEKIMTLIVLLFATRWDKFYMKELLEKQIQNGEYDKVYDFLENVGVTALFTKKQIHNLHDYVFGVEVGLDSHARKNRTGTLMEKAVAKILKDIENKGKIDWSASQLTLTKVFPFILQKNQLSEKLQAAIEKVSFWKKKFDFIYQAHKTIFFVECNVYNSQGSKIDSTFGQYCKLSKEIDDLNSIDSNLNFAFVWITGGFFWKNNLKKFFLFQKKLSNLLTLKDFYHRYK